MIFSSFHKKQNKELNKGFSLLEVLVAIIILGLVATPILKAFVTSAKLTRDAKQKQVYTAFATNVCETMKGFDPRVFAPGDSKDINGDTYVVNSVVGNSYDITVSSGTFVEYKAHLSITEKAGFDVSINDLEDMHKFRDAIFKEDQGKSVEAYNEMCQEVTDWLNTKDELFVYTTDYVKEHLKDKISISKELTCTADDDEVTVSIVYKGTATDIPYKTLGNVEHTGSFSLTDVVKDPSEPIAFDSSGTGARLERVYLYYYPAYSKELAAGYRVNNDRIKIINSSTNDDIKFYLIKQIEHTNTDLTTSEASYTPEVSVSGDSGNHVLYHNLNENISGTGVAAAYSISGCIEKTMDELVDKDNVALVHDLTIEIYKDGDPSTVLHTLKGTR